MGTPRTFLLKIPATLYELGEPLEHEIHLDLKVTADDAGSAKELFEAVINRQLKEAEDPRCPKCGSKNVRLYRSVLTVYPPIHVTTTECLACGQNTEERRQGKR